MVNAKNSVKALICAVSVLVMTATSVQAAGGGAGAKKDGPLYVDFKHIVVPIIKENGRTSMVALNVMAEVKDDSAKTKVTDHMPRLRDAFIRSLYGHLEGPHFKRADGSLNIDQIKMHLMKTAAMVMKDQNDPIKDILFQDIAHQTY